MIHFQSFWWLHVLLAALFLGLLWLISWYFLLKGKNKASPPLDHRWQKDVAEIPDEAEGLMGKPVMEQGVSMLAAEDFGFVDKTRQLGMVPDLQRDIRDICRVIAENDGNKEEFLLMFPMIREKYPWAAKSALLPQLNGFIRESVPFHLSEEELENLWS